MTNTEALKVLNQVKTFCSSEQLEAVDYVIEILDKMDKSGVKDPLSADFTKVENSK